MQRRAAKSKPHRKTSVLPLDDTLPAAKPRKVIPHEFVLEAIAAVSPWTRPPQFTIGAVAPVPAPEKGDEPRCNLEFLDVEVAIQPDLVGHSIKTASATFENKYIEGHSLRTPTLKGRLIFKRPDGHVVLDLSDVAWWPDEKAYAKFSANSPRRLLLFFSPSPEAAEANLWARSVRPAAARIGGLKSRVSRAESHPINEQIGSIEVQLLTETECLCRKVLKFEGGGHGFPKFVGVEALAAQALPHRG